EEAAVLGAALTSSLITKSPQLVATVANHVRAGSSRSVGLGTCWGGRGLGLAARTQVFGPPGAGGAAAGWVAVVVVCVAVVGGASPRVGSLAFPLPQPPSTPASASAASKAGR